MSLSLISYGNDCTEFLDFDMDDLDLINFSDLSSADYSDETCAPSPSSDSDSNTRDFDVIKSTSLKRTGSKVSKPKKVPSKRAFRKGLTVQEALSSCRMPNMSRRPPTNVLVAFPHFDRCDSLLYFPNTLVRHLNTADTLSISKLLTAHVDKDCKIRFVCGDLFEFTTKAFMRITEISNDLEPDRIMCVHSTKVVENTIRSTVYMKLTDSQPLYKLMACVCKDPDVHTVCIPDRTKRFNLYAKDVGTTEKVKQDLLACATTHEDVLFYMKLDLTLTFDGTTKKIVDMEHTYELTSLHVVSDSKIVHHQEIID